MHALNILLTELTLLLPPFTSLPPSQLIQQKPQGARKARSKHGSNRITNGHGGGGHGSAGGMGGNSDGSGSESVAADGVSK